MGRQVKESQRELAEQCFEVYKTLIKTVPIRKAITELAVKTGVDKHTLYRWQKIFKWDELLQVKATGTTAKVAKLAPQQIKKVPGSLEPLLVETPKDYATVDVLADVRAAAAQAVQIHQKIVKQGFTMIEHYSQLIDQEIEKAGGVEHLNEFSMNKIEGYMLKTNLFKEEIKEFIKPVQIASYLKIAGIDFSQDMGGVDKAAFTVDNVQKLILELGVSPNNSILAVEKMFEKENLPDIRGIR